MPRRRKLLLSLAIPAVLVLLAEAFLRWQGRFPPDPLTCVGEYENDPVEPFVADPALGWRMRPSHDHESRAHPGITYHYNAQGFRRPTDFEPKGARPRIVLLGDSFTHGDGVAYGDTYGSMLEERLGNVEVLNLGLPAFGVDQMWRCLREVGLPLEPDLVVVGLFAGDFRRSQRAHRLGVGLNKPAFKVVDGALVSKTSADAPNALFRWLDRNSHVWAVGQIAVRWVGFRRPFGEFWHLNEALLDAIRADCREAGVPVLFLYFPYRSWNTFPTLQDYMERTDANFVHLPSALGWHPDRIFLGDGHFNAEGHAVVSDLVAGWIEERGLFSGD